MLTSDQVVQLLEQRVRQAGSVQEFCTAHPGVDTPIIYRVLKGTSKPTPAVLLTLGLRRVSMYAPVPRGV